MWQWTFCDMHFLTAAVGINLDQFVSIQLFILWELRLCRATVPQISVCRRNCFAAQRCMPIQCFPQVWNILGGAVFPTEWHCNCRMDRVLWGFGEENCIAHLAFIFSSLCYTQTLLETLSYTEHKAAPSAKQVSLPVSNHCSWHLPVQHPCCVNSKCTLSVCPWVCRC